MYDKVHWPDGYGPNVSAIYALNDIDVSVPPQVVWDLLIDAENWSSYFPPEDQVEIFGGEPKLLQGSMFSRVTVGFPMSLQVTEFEPTWRLSWRTVVDGHPDSTAYHGWVITATATGCRVLTEETHKARSSSKNSDARTPVRSTATTRIG